MMAILARRHQHGIMRTRSHLLVMLMLSSPALGCSAEVLVPGSSSGGGTSATGGAGPTGSAGSTGGAGPMGEQPSGAICEPVEGELCSCSLSSWKIACWTSSDGSIVCICHFGQSFGCVESTGNLCDFQAGCCAEPFGNK